MKKVLLGLTTLLLISCVNLNEPKVQKVVNSPKSSTKNNVVKTQKEEKKKAIPTTNKTNNIILLNALLILFSSLILYYNFIIKFILVYIFIKMLPYLYHVYIH